MKIAVGLSGGIDSASSALKLKNEGHEVIGITMHLFNHQMQEIENARQVANQIGIPHFIADFREAFEIQVISPFIEAYEQGETPNPCLFCNQSLKYGKLLDFASSKGADYFATGHYANVKYDKNLNLYQLYKANHKPKDQSYNLYHLTQSQLSKLIFPLGDAISKQAVRETYSKISLQQSDKKDSQGICFIERGAQTHFLKSRGSHASEPGYFVDAKGRRLGRHLGISHYTIGQKRKLGLSVPHDYVVIAIDGNKNHVVLGKENDLYKEVITLKSFHFINPSQILPAHVSVKTSQWSSLYTAMISLNADGNIQIDFNQPVRGITPGQAIVCYDDDILLGGGIYHI